MADSYIIRGPNLLSPIIGIKTNQLNALNGDKKTDPPRKRNSQTPEDHFKPRKSPPKTSPVVSDIMGRLNNHAIDNGDVEVHP